MRPYLVALVAALLMLPFASVAFATESDPSGDALSNVRFQDHEGEEEEAAEEQEAAQEEGEGSTFEVKEVVLWTIVGIGAGALVLGALYMLKRRVGGFPEDPAWVAPITIMPASESPDDSTYGMAGDAHGGHGAAASHH